ncbi:DUF4435 domain-containing protein [Bordetella genomosp. 6]|uniref:DUF4435 domain-containing protein n=1 Tax=Bordetella genomosp. 6 TaxID=463024 RepID=A0ABX4F7D2_9BORD|nr:DUF4435 domain-containing protein [Bordetella genomosp. 6]OZI70118.1 hypothetical protein CAL23_21305 [Bordetella genomosp. 6]
MNYKNTLADAAGTGHVAFHEYAINLNKENSDTIFLFFEGDEDPSFYMQHIQPRLRNRVARIFICYGRSQVLTAHRLIQRDGRAPGRTLFFVDKDHNDILEIDDTAGLTSVYQTQSYSIENYLVSEELFRRFWTHRLHLSEYDARLPEYISRLNNVLTAFRRRGIVITSLILCGRGIDERNPVKLNLNNVQLDRVFKFNWNRNECLFHRGAGKHLIQSTNLREASDISLRHLITIARRHLKPRAPTSYLRGKYELWIFWKVLRQFSAELSSKGQARSTGNKRATPAQDLPWAIAVESLSAISPCPQDLNEFLSRQLH